MVGGVGGGLAAAPGYAAMDTHVIKPLLARHGALESRLKAVRGADPLAISESAQLLNKVRLIKGGTLAAAIAAVLGGAALGHSISSRRH